MRRIIYHDEELAAGTVRTGRARHRNHAFGVLQRIVEAVGREFPFDAVAGASHAYALGISPLDHETGDDAMENHSIIKALAHQRHKVFYGIRRNFRI